ncbi:MAG: menaquinone biosynthesis decarboxylase [Candidatus Omnitrophota bacterium]|nr:MAG: menaquinone biosynthesis decarboxylase [Candidatus Omnitrophota bacterium]
MAFHNLSDFVELLKQRNELVEITQAVSPRLEITEITDRVSKAGGPALLFTHPAGYDIPVLINAYGSERRMALALGVEHVDEIAERIRSLIQLKPPKSFREKLAMLFQLKEMAGYAPKRVGDGRCKEVIYAEDASLEMLPILTCWPMDGGPFITLPQVYTRDPATGVRNVGLYRMQVFDRQTTGMHWQIHKVGAAHCREYRKENRRMEVAVALGGDPAILYAASAPLPPNIDELLFCGFLRQAPVELVRCETVDVEVPADAEIVIEGYIDPSEERMEGPFGDHTGYYSLAEPYPVFHITGMTMAKEPIYPTTIVGIPPMEDAFLGKATERIFLPLIQMTFPEIVDLNLPVEGGFHSLALVSIKKSYPGHAYKVAHAIWGTGLLSLTKNIIVVDAHVNVQDPAEVLWRVANNVAPQRDVQFVKGPVDALDNSSEYPRFGSKMVIDATRKMAEEGFTREWPPDIRMTQDVKEKVDHIWEELGLPISLEESKRRIFRITPE